MVSNQPGGATAHRLGGPSRPFSGSAGSCSLIGTLTHSSLRAARFYSTPSRSTASPLRICHRPVLDQQTHRFARRAQVSRGTWTEQDRARHHAHRHSIDRLRQHTIIEDDVRTTRRVKQRLRPEFSHAELFSTRRRCEQRVEARHGAPCITRNSIAPEVSSRQSADPSSPLPSSDSNHFDMNTLV